MKSAEKQVRTSSETIDINPSQGAATEQET
jgi:hypothetical protein